MVKKKEITQRNYHGVFSSGVELCSISLYLAQCTWKVRDQEGKQLAYRLNSGPLSSMWAMSITLLMLTGLCTTLEWLTLNIHCQNLIKVLVPRYRLAAPYSDVLCYLIRSGSWCKVSTPEPHPTELPVERRREVLMSVPAASLGWKVPIVLLYKNIQYRESKEQKEKVQK